MTTEKDDNTQISEIHPHEDVVEAIDEALWAVQVAQASCESQALLSPSEQNDDRDFYVKLAIVLLGAGRAFRERDATALRKIATAAKLSDHPASTDPDYAGGVLRTQAKSAAVAGARVRALFGKDWRHVDDVAEHLARLVLSIPGWRACCLTRGKTQHEDGQRVAARLKAKFGQKILLNDLDDPSRDRVTAAKIISQALQALGATSSEGEALSAGVKKAQQREENKT